VFVIFSKSTERDQVTKQLQAIQPQRIDESYVWLRKTMIPISNWTEPNVIFKSWKSTFLTMVSHYMFALFWLRLNQGNNSFIILRIISFYGEFHFLHVAY